MCYNRVEIPCALRHGGNTMKRVIGGRAPMVDEKQPIAAWQHLLSQILDSEEDILPGLAEDLGMHQDSIKRWTQGKVPHNAVRTLHTLLSSSSFPDKYRTAFVEAVRTIWPEFELTANPLLQDLPVKEIPSIFYSQLYRSFAYVAEDLVFWTICNTICHQLFGHLDADQSAQVSAMILLCTPPPADACVQSFYAPVRQIGERVSPLPASFPLIAGLETPLTDVTPRYQRPLLFDERDIHSFPSLPFPPEVVSLLCLPIQRRGKVAGVFLATSHKPAYWNRERALVAYEYGLLLGLAFRDQDFFSKEQLCLAQCPPALVQQQQELRFPFRQRVQKLRAGRRMNYEQLEVLALQGLEQDLLQLEAE